VDSGQSFSGNNRRRFRQLLFADGCLDLEAVVRRTRTGGDLDFSVCREVGEAVIDFLGIGIDFRADIACGLGGGGYLSRSVLKMGLSGLLVFTHPKQTIKSISGNKKYCKIHGKTKTSVENFYVNETNSSSFHLFLYFFGPSCGNSVNSYRGVTT
jgi:hypothetical protein